MSKFALYPGCLMQTEQYAYEMSLRATLPLLNIELIDIDDFSCCGEPLKSVNQMITLYLSARNLAIAEKAGLDIFAPCAMCHMALSECKYILTNDPKQKERINATLDNEGLRYEGNINIIHTIDFLHDYVGVDEIKKKSKKLLRDLKIATHYGCRLI